MSEAAFSSVFDEYGVMRERAPFYLGGGVRLETEAHLSRDEKFRYFYSATWMPSLPALLAVMLNPSKGRAGQGDPTLVRLISFAMGWQFGSVHVLNLAALISPDPRNLSHVADAIGLGNARYFREAGKTRFGAKLCAWGASNLGTLRRGYRPEILDQLAGLGSDLKCLGLTKDGHPKHPLYLPKDCPLEDFTLNRTWWETDE